MRVVFTLFIFLNLLFSSTSQKISSSQSSIQSASQKEEQITKKLEDIAKDIAREQKKLNSLKDEIVKVQNQIKSLQQETKDSSKRLEELKEESLKLKKTKQEIEEQLIRVISEHFSFDFVIDKNYIESSSSIIGDEVLKETRTLLQKDFKELSSAYSKTDETIKKQNIEISALNEKLSGLKEKEALLNKLQNDQTKTIASLDKENKSYKNRLNEISKQKKELQATLEKLKIIKIKEDEKRAQEAAEAEARKALEKAPQQAIEEGDVQKVTVRQIGSSYQNSQVKKYAGSKTIAPLDSFEVLQRFGNYIDPIYNIKIFNESVILRSKTTQATVKNVLDGKVVFAKQTNMLDHVVIVENSNGIHTIFAHLNQIAPTIAVGKKIKKGYVLGRVERDLTFEVTQKNFHIDPLELINLK